MTEENNTLTVDQQADLGADATETTATTETAEAATPTADAVGDAVKAEAADKAAADSDAPERIFIMVTMPKELFDKIDHDAKERNVGRATYARELLAGIYGYTLPESGTTSRKKYETDADREAARKKATADRQRLQAVLMIVHRMKMNALTKGQPVDEAAFTVKAEAEYDAKQAAKAEKAAKEAAEKEAAKIKAEELSDGEKN